MDDNDHKTSGKMTSGTMSSELSGKLSGKLSSEFSTGQQAQTRHQDMHGVGNHNDLR